MKTVLIVSPHFPPSQLAGVHRARHLAKHLPAHGWRPIVVRVDERHYAEAGDSELAALVPPSVEQIWVGAVPARPARVVGVGDIGLRAFFPIRLALARLAAQLKPEIIFITGSPFYPMLLSGWAKRRLKIPVVLDFQDPWVSDEGATRPRWSKGGAAHYLAMALEPRAVRNASFITSVSKQQNEEMAERYPWLDRDRMAGIPIGGDPDDFDAVRSMPAAAKFLLNPDTVNFCYVGAFWPRAAPTVRTLLRALREVRIRHPDLARRMRLYFIGTDPRPGRGDLYSVRPLAEAEGVLDLVFEAPQRVPFVAALDLLSRAHGALMFGSVEPHYTASKIYSVLMSGRPYVSLFHARSSAHAILCAAGGGRALSFEHADELPSVTPALADALVSLATNPEQFGRADPVAYAAFTAYNVAGAFARVFDATTAGRPA